MSVLTSSPSTNGESADGQPNEQKKAKVCLCCGSYTIFAVSIREPTHGLNMMDVIMEKFNRQPCDDDRYLCYSCNNWLIDWFTRRKQSDNEDAPDTTTPIGADTSGIQRIDENTEMISCIDDNRECVDVNNIIETIRQRLKKYIYRRHQSNCSDQSGLVSLDNEHESNYRLREAHAGLADDTERTICGYCHRRRIRYPTKSQRSVIRFCRTCRFSMRRKKLKSKRMQLLLARRRPYATQNAADKMTSVNRSTDIVEKLKRLGTSIYYESDCKYCLSDGRAAYAAASVMSNAHEIDTICGTQGMMQNRPATESNEILITFDTVVTEVFPIDSLYGSTTDTRTPTNCIDNIKKHNCADIAVPNIRDILKNVPESLSITLT